MDEYVVIQVGKRGFRVADKSSFFAKTELFPYVRIDGVRAFSVRVCFPRVPTEVGEVYWMHFPFWTKAVNYVLESEVIVFIFNDGVLWYIVLDEERFSVNWIGRGAFIAVENSLYDV